MANELRKNWDVYLIISGTIILIVSIELIQNILIRTLLGLPFLLFFPGYSLLLVLFPNRSEIEIIERIGLSFGISMAITPLSVFILYIVSFSLDITLIITILSILNIIFSIIGYYRRQHSSTPYLPFSFMSSLSKELFKFKDSDNQDRLSSILLIVSIFLIIIVVFSVMMSPPQGESYSEFMIFGNGYSVSNYPTNITINDTNEVIIGINNHEHRLINYTVEIWLLNNSDDNITDIHSLYFMDNISLTVENSENSFQNDNLMPQISIFFNFTINVTGHYKLWFILYEDKVPSLPHEPHRFDNFINTAAVQRIFDSVDNKYQSLNLNLNITT